MIVLIMLLHLKDILVASIQVEFNLDMSKYDDNGIQIIMLSHAFFCYLYQPIVYNGLNEEFSLLSNNDSNLSVAHYSPQSG